MEPSSSGNSTITTDDVNSSCVVDKYEAYDQLSVSIIGYTALPVMCFGWVANTLSARIWSNRQMRHAPINWYLCVLSCSDFMILTTSFLMLTLPRLAQTLRMYQIIAFSYSMTPYLFGLALLSQTISVYMTVLMSVHRYIGVCFPFKAHEILSRMRVRLAIGGTIVFSILFNFTRFFEVTIPGACYYVDIDAWLPQIGATSLRQSQLYKLIFHGWLNTMIMFAVPFVTLIIVNSMVIKAIHHTAKMHRGMQGEDDATKRHVSQRSKELAKEISTSVMLVGVVLVFLSCNSLSFILNILENLGLDRDHEGRTTPTFSALVEINNLLIVVNGSINIFVYMLFSEKYRNLLQYYTGCYCCGCRDRHNAELLMPTASAF